MSDVDSIFGIDSDTYSDDDLNLHQNDEELSETQLHDIHNLSIEIAKYDRNIDRILKAIKDFPINHYSKAKYLHEKRHYSF